MKLTEEVRAAAESGLAQKAEEFRAAGSEIFMGAPKP
jgi:hypothetical protein